MQKTWVQFLGWEDSPGGGKWQPAPVFLPGKSLDREWQAIVHEVAKIGHD